MANKKCTVLGLMSGSSLDGLDLAICTFALSSDGKIAAQTLATASIPFQSDLEERLGRATMISAKDLFLLQADFSKFCGIEILKFVKKTGHTVDYLAVHGHTVFHHPEDGFTVQIGNGSIMASITDIPCISDFRSADIALGGEGAPLAPIVEQHLLPGYHAYFNLGGIANLSVHLDHNILSLDSCPCNQVLNTIAGSLGLTFDDEGVVARSGKVSESLIEKWQDLEYFSRPIPKSMDNSWVTQEFIPVMESFKLSPADKLASAAEFIALQLSSDYRNINQGSVGHKSGLVTGGGTFNKYLVERLTRHFNKLNLKLIVPDEELICFKEAILMALMGFLRINNLPNTIPSVTGASASSIGGAIYIPGK